MLLRDMAHAFELLEAASARRTLVQIVADLLAHADPPDREPIVLLLQGQLRPSYEGVELGVGDKLLIHTVAEAFSVDEPSVVRRYAKLGDLGLVAQTLVTRPPRRRPTVRQAYDALLAVAKTSGSGSIRDKTDRLADLLRKLDGLEAKYVVRAAQGRLRLGVGDQTILEAAAVAALGERTKKKVLEHAYNVRSDLGGVVNLAFATGERGLVAIGPEIGIPVRPALAQRLPSAEAIIKRVGQVQAEPKYDGFRIQLHRDGDRTWAFSRRLENVTDMFPDLAAAATRQLKTKRAILEGEALVHNPETGEFLPFQVTMTRKRKTRISETAERYPLRLFAFDLLFAGDVNYMPRPQQERSRRLRALLPSASDDPITVTESILSDDAKALQAYFDAMIERGLEGIVAKRPTAPYQAGARGYDWVKLKRAYQSKLRDTVDLVLVGYLRGRGKRAALGIGSLLATVYDPSHDRFRTIAKIGSGLSDRDWQTLRVKLDDAATKHRPARVDSLIIPDVWVQPTYVVEVLADEITRSPFHTCGKTDDEPGYALRFPRLLSLRTDKSPTDATTEREIIELYRMQRAPRGNSPPKAMSTRAKKAATKRSARKS